MLSLHTMKVDMEVEVWLHLFLTSTGEGGEWSASLSSHLSTGEGRRLLGNVTCTLADWSLGSKCDPECVLMRAAMNLQVPYSNFLVCWIAVTSSRRLLVCGVGLLGFLTLSLLMSYICGAPCKTRNFNVVYIWTGVWQSWKPSFSIFCTMLQHWINAESYPVAQLRVNTLLATKITLITDSS
jgi:hypothetical protein